MCICLCVYIYIYMGIPGGASGKKPTCECKRHRRHGFDPWARKIPWRRTYQPTTVFLPGESHGQRSLGDTFHSVAKSWTWLKHLGTHVCVCMYVCVYIYIYIIKQNLKVWCNNPVCEIAPSAQSWYQMKCSLLPEDGGVAGGFTVSFPPRCLVFMLCIPSYVSSKVVSPGFCQTFVWSFPLWSREVNSDKRRRLPWNTCKSYFKPSVLSNLKPFPLFFSLPKSSFLFRWEDKRTCTRSLSRPSTKGPGLVPSTPSLGLWDGFSAASASADAAILSLGASLIFAFYWIVLINVQDAVIASRQEILLRSSGFLPISVLTSKLLKSSF